MRRWTWVWIVSISLLLAACSGNHDPAAQSGSGSGGTEQVMPTGYPADEVQRPCIYYNGSLYLYSAEGFDKPLEKGFEKVGTVAAVDNTKYPSEEFHGARLERGQEVYADENASDKIYVKYDSGFGSFEKDADSVPAGKDKIPYINDGSADWSEVKTIYLYGEGCAVPPTHTIGDRETVSLLVEQVKNAEEYELVSENDLLEGINGLWVEFDNGVCISMHRGANYGTVSKKKETTGTPPYYHFPEAFRETVMHLLQTPVDYDVMIRDVKAYDVDKAVSAAILKENRDHYLDDECIAEGHTILGTEEEGDRVTAYTLAMFGGYQFQDGNLVKNSGSGAIPTVMTFKRGEDGTYSLTDYKTAQDGSLYTPSIKEMFPEEFWEICISPSDDDIEALTKQEREYASAYLKKLGREAKIGDYSDFEHTLLTGAGVSVDVSNRLLEKEGILPDCPSWIGTIEKLEHGVRYRYETAYDPQKKEIIYTKTDVEANTVVEETVFNSETGAFVSHRNTADKKISQSEAAVNSLAGVSMEAVEGSVTAASVRLRLKNETEKDIMFGDVYAIQRYADGQWHSVPYIIDNWGFHEVAYPLFKGEPQEADVDWEVFHGILEPGRYRIIKPVDDFRGTGDFTKYYLGTEFEIKSQPQT